MSIFLTEIIGTAILIVLGNGVVANVVLNKTKGNNSGWIVITFGWAIAVFVAVFVCSKMGGNAHLNPAVTVALAYLGKAPWGQVPIYIAAQLIGAIIGSVIVYVSYMQHFDATDDKDGKLAVFCNAPAIRSSKHNLLTEIIGTFLFVFAILFISKGDYSLGSLDALTVALLVFGIGLSLGGPTGYAINPARDLGPRIAHFLLPIKNKRDSDWAYSWIPVVGPCVGGLIAAIVFQLCI
jgi:glycerol uptake facilitator protein